MADLTPTNPPALLLWKVRRMIASSSTFQDATGCTGLRDSAKLKVHVREFDPLSATNQPERPAACISIDGMEWGPTGANQLYLPRAGIVFLYLCKDTPKHYYEQPVNAYTDALNFVGGVLNDLANDSGKDQTYDTTVTDSEAIIRPELLKLEETPEQFHESLGRYFFAACALHWSNTGE